MTTFIFGAGIFVVAFLGVLFILNLSSATEEIPTPGNPGWNPDSEEVSKFAEYQNKKI